jgi:hypothetical protein
VGDEPANGTVPFAFHGPRLRLRIISAGVAFAVKIIGFGQWTEARG